MEISPGIRPKSEGEVMGCVALGRVGGTIHLQNETIRLSPFFHHPPQNHFKSYYERQPSDTSEWRIL